MKVTLGSKGDRNHLKILLITTFYVPGYTFEISSSFPILYMRNQRLRKVK